MLWISCLSDILFHQLKYAIDENILEEIELITENIKYKFYSENLASGI